MSSETILPDSVAIFKNIEAFDLAAKAWIDDLKLETLLVYLIDQVDADALPVLAEQFDVLGYKGWKLANSEDDKRSLIKKAIELHRYKGTVWAVKEAMKSIGFTDAVLIEHTGVSWATFKVQLFNKSVPITTESIADLHRMIEEYKNTRSDLEEIFIVIEEGDTIVFEDESDIVGNIDISDDVHYASALFYNGQDNYDGTYDHSGDSDLITFDLV